MVTNGQIPKWLNINNPKIKLVTHSQIMPQNALPTFSSPAIEACIVNIPNLSDRFLYSNDDMYIVKTVSEKTFFNKNGYPIVRLNQTIILKRRLKSVMIGYLNLLLKSFIPSLIKK